MLQGRKDRQRRVSQEPSRAGRRWDRLLEWSMERLPEERGV